MGDSIIKNYPDTTPMFKNMEHRHERQQLESTLARTFVQWRRTVEPSERSRLWNAMEEAVRELEKLNNE